MTPARRAELRAVIGRRGGRFLHRALTEALDALDAAEAEVEELLRDGGLLQFTRRRNDEHDALVAERDTLRERVAELSRQLADAFEARDAHRHGAENLSIACDEAEKERATALARAEKAEAWVASMKAGAQVLVGDPRKAEAERDEARQALASLTGEIDIARAERDEARRALDRVRTMLVSEPAETRARIRSALLAALGE